MDKRDRIKNTRDFLLNNLPKTVSNNLYNADPAVHSFVELMARSEDKDFLSIIDEMFIHYTRVIFEQGRTLDEFYKYGTPEQVRKLTERSMKG